MSEPARTGVAVTGAARIAYEVQGQGEPLLLLHGAEGTRHMFGDLVILLRASFTCISFDQRGCGETQAPLAPYTADDIADDACAVLAPRSAASWRRAWPRATPRACARWCWVTPGPADRCCPT